jgi:hypothetical protein
MVGQFFGCILLVKGSAGGLCFLLPGGTSLWPHCDRARRLTHRSIEPLPTPFFFDAQFWPEIVSWNWNFLIVIWWSSHFPIPFRWTSWTDSYSTHSYIYIYSMIFHDFHMIFHDFPWTPWVNFLESVGVFHRGIRTIPSTSRARDTRQRFRASGCGFSWDLWMS